MTMFSTQYANNSRIVAGGTTTPVYNDDSILLCDTSTGAITIDLSTIPANYWNTIWKLYVYDNGNNASTNNITINAGSGQTINGSSTLVLNSNGGNVLIRISSNTTFLAISSASAPTSGYQYIQNQTTPNLTQRNTIRFIGANVVASDNSTDAVTEVTISGGGGLTQAYQYVKDDSGSALTQRNTLNFIGGIVVASDNGGTSETDITIEIFTSLTRAAMLTLMSTNALIQGKFYYITDASPTLPSCNGVVVQALSTTYIATTGYGFFYNADYQNVGSYSGSPTFCGIWSDYVPASFTSANSVVIYDNKHWQNVGNVWSPAPSSSTNWTQLGYNTGNGYIFEIDQVRYDIDTNLVVWRADKRRNEVYGIAAYSRSLNSILDFQWGRDLVSGNIVQSLGYMGCTNSSATFYENMVNSGSQLLDNTNANPIGFASFLSNTLSNYSFINNSASTTNTYAQYSKNFLSSSQIIVTESSDSTTLIQNNHLSSLSTITSVTLTSTEIVGNTLSNASTISLGIAADSFVNYNSLTTNSNVEFTGTTSMTGFTFTKNTISNYSYVKSWDVCGATGIISQNDISNCSSFNLYSGCSGAIKFNKFFNTLVDLKAISSTCQIYQNTFDYSSLRSSDTLAGQINGNTANGYSLLYFDIFPSGAYFTKNLLSSGATITYSPSSTSYITNSTFTSGGGVSCIGGADTLKINKCYSSNNGILKLFNYAASNLTFSYCEWSDNCSIEFSGETATYTNCRYNSGFSNWTMDLDLADANIFNNGTQTLTIPNDYAANPLNPLSKLYVGIFTIKNPAGRKIKIIINPPLNHPYTFIAGSGTGASFSFDVDIILLATANDVITTTLINPSLASSSVTYRSASVSDRMVLQSINGGILLNIITEVDILS